MTSRKWLPWLAALSVVCVPAGPAGAQVAAPAPPSATAARQALAEGRVADAGRLADVLVRQAPRSRDAAALQVEIRLAAHETARAFAAYDRYANLVGAPEIGMLRMLAANQLRDAAANTEDVKLICAALERLARSGDQPALQQLRQISEKNRETLAGAQADAALARLGDPAATSRLASVDWVSISRDQQAVVELLTEVPGQGASAQLRGMLEAPSPQTRATAAAALARRGDKDSIAALRQMLSDEWPEVRSWAALALKRLGDTAGDEAVSRMMKSPLSEVRVEAAVADATAPGAGRTAELKAALSDPDALTRLKAAKALLAVEPAAAKGALGNLATSASPQVRAEAAAALEDVLPPDLRLVRRLLTDGSDWVRVHAAGAALKAAASK